MESAAPKPQRVRRPRRERKTVKVVETQTTETARRRRRRGGRRRRKTTLIATPTGQALMTMARPSQQSLRRITRRIRKLEKNEHGCSVQDIMHTTLTLGPINGTQHDDLVKHMRVWLNPTMLKPFGAGTTATPLNIRAAMYNMYRIQKLTVVVKALVGNSNVSGTLILIDIDQESSSAKPDNIDTIKARSHIQLPVGASKNWRVPHKNLLGPREGWWLIDTNEDPSLTLGPALNLSTYIQSVNLLSYTATQAAPKNVFYEGPLALVELQVSYQFCNYTPKPALAHLKRDTAFLEQQGKDTGKVVFTNGANGELVLKVPKKSVMGQSMLEVDYRNLNPKVAGQSTKTSNILWSIGSTAVDTLSSALGPWGWLLRGGWWVVKRLLGAPTRDDDMYFYCYASVEDAMRDSPVIQPLDSGSGSELQLPDGDYHWSQLNSDNLEVGTELSVKVANNVIQFGGDYLPLACADTPQKFYPPAYTFDTVTGDVTPGLPGVTLPPIGVGAYVDCDYMIYGHSTCWCWEMDGEQSQKTITMNMVVRAGKRGTQSWRFNCTGSYINYFDLTRTAIFQGFQELRSYGIVHTAETFLNAVKQYSTPEQQEKLGQGCPMQLFMWVDEWETNHRTLDTRLHEERIFGTHTLVMPLVMFNDHFSTEWVPTGSGQWEIGLKNDAWLLAWHDETTSEERLGILCVTSRPPRQGDFQFVYATNVNVKSRWQERQTQAFFQYEKIPLQKYKNEPEPETDEDEHSDYEVVRRKRR
nr:MAG: capsid protein [Astroviridae sp.]